MRGSARAGGTLADLQDRFLFKTYEDVLREFGRPDRVSRSPQARTFHYRIPIPGTERTAWLALGFADGSVFQVSKS